MICRCLVWLALCTLIIFWYLKPCRFLYNRRSSKEWTLCQSSWIVNLQNQSCRYAAVPTCRQRHAPMYSVFMFSTQKCDHMRTCMYLHRCVHTACLKRFCSLSTRDLEVLNSQMEVLKEFPLGSCFLTATLKSSHRGRYFVVWLHGMHCGMIGPKDLKTMQWRLRASRQPQ